MLNKYLWQEDREERRKIRKKGKRGRKNKRKKGESKGNDGSKIYLLKRDDYSGWKYHY